MTDYHDSSRLVDVNRLVDEAASGGWGSKLAPEELMQLSRAIAENPDFARRTAEVLLTARTLDRLTIEPRRPQLDFTPPSSGSSIRRFLLPAAMLLAGLAIGLRWPQSPGDGGSPGAAEPALVLRMEIPAQLPLSRPEATVALAPHHYADGLFAGKTVQVASPSQ